MRISRKYFTSHLISLVVCSVMAITPSYGSLRSDVKQQQRQTMDEEELPNITLKPIRVYERGVDQRRYRRLVLAVKRVYPIAKIAQQKLQAMQEDLSHITSKREQRELVRSVYREIKDEYTPVLLKMSMTDGRVLIRLIDRETDFTAYEVIDEFRGGLTAAFWQGISRMFGQNLKDEYGKSSEDRMIEMIIKHYEAGLL